MGEVRELAEALETVLDIPYPDALYIAQALDTLIEARMNE